MGKEELAAELQVLTERYMRAQLWQLSPYTLAIPSGSMLHDAFFAVVPTMSFDQWCSRAGEDVDDIRNQLKEQSNDAAIDTLIATGSENLKVEINGEKK